jgi:membrane dipeptidase
MRPDPAAFHEASLVLDAASFFLQGYSEDLAASGVDAFNIMAPWPADGFEQAVMRIEDYRTLVRRDERLAIAEQAADILAAKEASRKAIVLGAQDSLFIGNRLERLDTFRRLGLRYLQLTYNERNLVGDGCAEPTDAGLSRFGRELVKAMPEAGIVMDVTHAGPRTALEALNLTSAPAIASHANPRGLYDNPRNLTDDVIRAIASTGGVVGCTLPSPFNYAGGDQLPTLSDFAAALEYVIDLVGDDHVTIGSDLVATAGAYHPDLSRRLRPDLFTVSGAFYGKFGTDPAVRKVQGISAMRDYPVLTRLLLERGHSPERVRKILGLNLMRVYEAVWPS